MKTFREVGRRPMFVCHSFSHEMEVFLQRRFRLRGSELVGLLHGRTGQLRRQGITSNAGMSRQPSGCGFGSQLQWPYSDGAWNAKIYSVWLCC